MNYWKWGRKPRFFVRKNRYAKKTCFTGYAGAGHQRAGIRNCPYSDDRSGESDPADYDRQAWRQRYCGEDCATVSRKISEVLDANDPIKDKYNLEVSSPGLDRPLTKPAHFARFAGYEAKVETDEAIENRKRIKGKITGLDEENKVHLEMDGREYVIPFDAVSKAKIVITDELLQKYVDEHPECGEHVIEE